MNYCKVKKSIPILWILIGILIIIILYIGIPFLQLVPTQSFQKVVPKNRWIQTVLILTIMGVLVIGLIGMLLYRTIIYNRQNRCFASYVNNYPKIQMNQPKLTYHNPYFNQTMPLLLRDFYILAAQQPNLPCGQYNDLASSDALQNVITRGARWLSMNFYWSDKTVYLSTGSGQTPSNLMFQKKLFSLEDGLKTCREFAWKQTNLPLFIYLQSEYLTESGMFPSLEIEKKIADYWAQSFYDRIPNPNYLNFKTELALCPISETLGKVFLILNWQPQEERLKQVVSEQIVNQQYPQNGIQQIKLVPNDIPYGGIKGKFVNMNELIEYNKMHFSYLNYETQPSIHNLTSPKSDIDNMDITDCLSAGIQIIPQHFTIFPGKQDCFLKTLQFFQTGPIQLKPDLLRYIPRPTEPIKQQYQELSYAPKQFVDSRPGFASINM